MAKQGNRATFQDSGPHTEQEMEVVHHLGKGWESWHLPPQAAQGTSMRSLLKVRGEQRNLQDFGP